MRVLICAGSAILLLTAVGLAETYLVRPDGTGDYPTIQAAINWAVDGDVILLADGTFTGNGNRDIDYLGKAITVRSRAGDPWTCIIDCEASSADPHRGFYFRSGEGETSVLQDVTITNARQAEAEPEYWGGGIFCSESSPTLSGCVISASSAWAGGGINYEAGCGGVITGCVFLDNGAAYGGGMICGQSSPEISDCIFVGNSASRGGALLITGIDANPAVTDCVFAGNSGVQGGAVGI
jgi:hypothetical protein